MTAQLPEFTEGSNSILKNSLLAHIPTQFPGKPFTPKASIYLLLTQGKSVSQMRSKFEAEI